MEKLHKKPDEQLLEDFLNGSRESLNILINRHTQEIKRYIFRITKNKDVAEDILQDTLIKVVQNLEAKRYRENGKFSPWVRRIAHNLIIDHYRAKKWPEILSDDYDYDILIQQAKIHENDSEEIIDDIQKNKLRVLIEQLPKEQRDTIKLRYYSGLSFKEIAEETEVSINTSLGRMRYALINLRKKIEATLE